MSMQIVGTCGSCGGRVVVPTIQSSIYPMTPKCERCNKTPKAYKPKVLEME